MFPYPFLMIKRGAKLAVIIIRADEAVLERICPLVVTKLRPLCTVALRVDDKACVSCIIEDAESARSAVKELESLEGVEVEVLKDRLSERGIAVNEKFAPPCFGDKRLIVLMADEMVEGFQLLRSKIGPAADAVFYHLGYSYGLSVGRYVLEGLGAKNFIGVLKRAREVAELFAKLATATGWGKFTVESVDPLHLRALISVEDSWEASTYIKTYGKSLRPICRFTAGVIAGSVASFLGRDAQCTEKECAAMGAKRCVFIVRAT